MEFMVGGQFVSFEGEEEVIGVDGGGSWKERRKVVPWC